MDKRTILIEHNGTEYRGELATIKKTTLGVEDHGIFTAFLHVEWKGGGVGAGGYCLDAPERDANDKFLGRVGSAYGLDHIMQILKTVGVSTWEELVGQHVIVLFNGSGGFGLCGGIAGATNDKVLIFKEHSDAWSERESVMT